MRASSPPATRSGCAGGPALPTGHRRGGDADVDLGADRLLDRLGEDPADEVVVALGQRDGDLPAGSAVELRGSPGPWPDPAGESAELHVEKTLVGEPLEVELRRVGRYVDRSGRLLAAHRVGLPRHEQVEPAADRVGERGDAGGVLGEVVAGVGRWQGTCKGYDS